MVWFQCEHCGENLKKPKLPIHFNRCLAYELSCIDCGVVFDQQSVQAHTSCVSEAEKYGPKGLNKGIIGPAAKARNVMDQKGSDVDFSQGLSTSPPWSCSLCNVKATSQETLELHGHGKKHQGRARAAAAKDKSETQGEGYAGVSANLKIGGSTDDVKEVETNDATASGVFNPARPPAEKKRKKERIGEGANPTSMPPGNLEKKLKRGTSTVLGTATTQQEHERRSESDEDPREKKRKLVEEHLETIVEENGQLAGKKRRKKGKLASGELNGNDNGYIGTPKVSGSTTIVGKDKIGEQLKKESQKGILDSPLGYACLSDIKGQTSRFVGSGLATALGSQGVSGKSIIYKKKKKSEGVHEGHVSNGSAAPAKVLQDDVCNFSKKEKKKNDQKEVAAYEMSFREWLGENNGTQGGTPTHHPLDIIRGKEQLKQLEGVEMTKQSEKSRTGSSLERSTRVVKWKKIIREVLCKSLNGKLKRKDFTRSVLPLAQMAIDSASISVERKTLKAEMMRQVTTSSKFVVDGNHVMLAPKV